MKQDNAILCIIGARGGSKRLPYKNIKPYGDTTLLGYAIRQAMQSKYIHKLIVDSEDDEILKHALKKADESDFNIKRDTPIFFETHLRNPIYSEDDVSLYQPIKKVIEENPEYDLIIILQVDQPAKDGLIDQCIERFYNMDKKTRTEKTFDDKQQFEEISTIHNNIRIICGIILIN